MPGSNTRVVLHVDVDAFFGAASASWPRVTAMLNSPPPPFGPGDSVPLDSALAVQRKSRRTRHRRDCAGGPSPFSNTRTSSQ